MRGWGWVYIECGQLAHAGDVLGRGRNPRSLEGQPGNS